MADDKGTPIVTEADLDEDSRWGSNNRIVEPELLNESGQKVRNGDEETEEEKPDDLEPEELEEVEDTTPEPTLEDPGEFIPQDRSFEVTVFNKEGKNGKTVKIASVEQWDKLLDEGDVNFGTASALLKAQRAATKLEYGLERDQADWQRAKDAYDAEQETFQGREEALDNLTNEMVYLEQREDMLTVPAQFRDNWDSPEAKKDPAVKQQQALISYMDKENRARIAAGLKPETSLVSAFKSWKLDQMEKEESESKGRIAEARKAAGARVASNSPAPISNVPKGIAVGRVLDLDHLGAGWR